MFVFIDFDKKVFIIKVTLKEISFCLKHSKSEVVTCFNIRKIHLNLQFFKDFQNSTFQSVIIACFGNTSQFQALTSEALTIAPALML